MHTPAGVELYVTAFFYVTSGTESDFQSVLPLRFTHMVLHRLNGWALCRWRERLVFASRSRSRGKTVKALLCVCGCCLIVKRRLKAVVGDSTRLKHT